ncbi:MAG: hypothetical protein IJT13_03970 [Bacteroidaceae bacterium]|nr:hypothetical protein [Bacteroidaceae bacterium]
MAKRISKSWQRQEERAHGQKEVPHLFRDKALLMYYLRLIYVMPSASDDLNSIRYSSRHTAYSCEMWH